ncbi:MAG TPA: FAD-binding oxidoreductase [Micromonosporaceae bacterium]
MTTLSGWGRTAPTPASLVPAAADDALAALVRGAGRRGVTARGLGRSYGDAGQNAGGTVIDMTSRTRILRIDPEEGVAVVEAGISLDRLMREVIPLGWFVPVTPGTRFVTVGGAIAADIHGKNHHVHGSFSRHVREFDLLCGDGEIRTVAQGTDLFWATSGGMGLTGVVLRATVQLLPIESSRMRVDTERATDLDDLMEKLTSTDHRYMYSVAWIDCLSRGARLGRGVLTRGWHANRADLPVSQRARALEFAPNTLVSAPPFLPSGLLNRYTIAAFNEMWYRRAPRERRDEIQPLATFFHPLDGVRDWNRIYGPKGFVQYQFVVPFGAEHVLRTAVESFARAGYASFLAVLKRFGEGDHGMLSFPKPGWTLALDIPVLPGLSRLLDHLDDLVVGAGGRIYLAKDSRMRPDRLSAMYPRLAEFRAVRDKYDPDRTLTSDLARRLAL